MDDQDAELRAHAFHLTPLMSNLLGLLLSVSTLTPQMMQRNLTRRPKQAMFRLRQQLKGFDIEIHQRRYVGYWIEDHDKARIRAFITSRGNNEAL